MPVKIRRAGASDAALLHSLAAATFALACPPGTTQQDIDDFVESQLSEKRFAGYLADRERELYIAEADNDPVGYTMVVFAEPADPDVAAALTAHPTAELSKCYVLAGRHGSGVASTLMKQTLDAAQKRGAAAVWLGVNQQNERANRFYQKHGFEVVGTKRFKVGGEWHEDYCRELVFSD